MELSSVCCLLAPLASLIARANCGSLYGIAIPKKGGKTNLLKNLEHNSYILVDLDAVMGIELDDSTKLKLDKLNNDLQTDSYFNMYGPLCKEYVKKLRNNFKHKNILVLHDNPDILKYIGCSKITYLSPSNSLVNNIIQVARDEEVSKLIMKTRESIIKHANKKLIVYNSWNELQDIIKNLYKLKAKL